MFLRKGALKICSKCTGKYPCRCVISTKLQSIFLEITLRHGCSLVNLLHIFRTPFPKKPLDGCFWKLNLPVIFNWKVLGKYGSFFVCNLLLLITVTLSMLIIQWCENSSLRSHLWSIKCFMNSNLK